MKGNFTLYFPLRFQGPSISISCSLGCPSARTIRTVSLLLSVIKSNPAFRGSSVPKKSLFPRPGYSNTLDTDPPVLIGIRSNGLVEATVRLFDR